MIITVTPNPVLDRTLTVPELAFDTVLRACDTRLDWGGKGFNVSRALRVFGVQSVAMGFVGGRTGETVSEGLQSEGIETDFVPIAGETRTNVVITDVEGHRHVKVNEAGPCVTPAEAAAFLDRAEARMRADDLWVLCGSLPPGLPDGFYADLTERVAQRGARVLLDTSGEPLRQGCATGPFLVKPNEVEIEQVTGIPVRSETDARRAVEHLRRSASTRVALTLGAGGMLLGDNAQIIWARPPHITARNAVGAGDALMAGLAWGISQDLPSPEVARWGVAAGSASAARAGVAVFSRAELEAMAERVSVESERTTGAM